MRAQGVINANYPRDPARTRGPSGGGGGGVQSSIKAVRKLERVGKDKVQGRFRQAPPTAKDSGVCLDVRASRKITKKMKLKWSPLAWRKLAAH